MISQFKQFIKIHKKEILLFAAVVLISLFSFALGYITAELSGSEPLKFE